MIINDILELIYAPVQAFKKIIENPKYLGAMIILLLFIGVQIGYEYAQFSKSYTEQTSPTIDQLATFTNSSMWASSPGVSLLNNYNDYFNYSVYVAGFGTAPTDPLGYYSLFGNSSLELDAVNTNSVTAALSNITVDCSANGFQNLSMTIKPVQPQAAPQNATLTIYSISDSNFYQYDLTSTLSGTAANEWNNLTIPVGPSAPGWTSSGAPEWGNVTALKLDFTYPDNSNVTIRIGALFFRGQFLTPIQYNNTGILLQFLQVFSLQFIFGWFLITGLSYLFLRLLKSGVTWKPLFIALGFALFVMVIRALVNLAATLTFPAIYYPYDMSLGVLFDHNGVIYYPADVVGTLSAQSQAIFNNISSLTAAFSTITTIMFAASYVWLGGLGTIIIGTLKPEFSMVKRVVISAVSIVVTVLLLWLLVGIA